MKYADYKNELLKKFPWPQVIIYLDEFAAEE